MWNCQWVILFFLCRVLEKRQTKQHISDDNDHHIPAGTGYMVVNYLEKASKNFWLRTVNYKIIEKQKIYITYNHVLSWGTYWKSEASYENLKNC